MDEFQLENDNIRTPVQVSDVVPGYHMEPQSHGGALMRIPKGTKGGLNPNGYSKKRREQDAFQKALSQAIATKDDGTIVTALDRLIEAAKVHAENGDSSFFKILMERAYGKVPDESLTPNVGDQTNIQVNINMEYVDSK